MKLEHTRLESRLKELGAQWAHAELRGDTTVLESILADDFVAVGPRGFVLDKEQYLEPRRSGDLRIEAFAWSDVTVREYGAAAIAVGIQTQQAAYRGQDASGRFRVTHVAVRKAGRWQVVGLHISGPIPNVPPGQG